MSGVSVRRRLVINDGRSAHEALRQILDRATASGRCDVRVAAALDAATELISNESPVAALVHAGFDPIPCGPGAGLLFVSLEVRREEAPIFLLFSGSPGSHELLAAQLALRVPIVLDEWLVTSFDHPIL